VVSSALCCHYHCRKKEASMTKSFLLLHILISLIQFSCECPRIVSREEWGGAQVVQGGENLMPPAFYWIIHQSNGPTCFNLSSCSIQMRNIQNFHLNSYGWPDIGYNFCIGQDGNVYEGRGWEKKTQNTEINGFNEHSLSICFLGTFDNVLPSFVSFLAAQELILCSINKGIVSSNYRLLAHRQVSDQNFNCPGDALYSEIKRNTKFLLNPKPITL
jgi:N-acetylmuramoyl-L-alanine amidase